MSQSHISATIKRGRKKVSGASRSHVRGSSSEGSRSSDDEADAEDSSDSEGGRHWAAKSKKQQKKHKIEVSPLAQGSGTGNRGKTTGGAGEGKSKHSAVTPVQSARRKFIS